jgi:hypothetical protein
VPVRRCDARHTSRRLRNVVVQEIVAVAQGALRILINRNDDRLDMLVTPPFAAGEISDLSECLDPRRILLHWRRTIAVVRASPAPAAEDLGFLRLLLLEAVSFGTELVNPVEHSL